MIIGILGLAGAGKDAVTDIIVKQGAQKLAFADSLKRMVRNLFGFSDEQMWGPMTIKETVDTRYPRKNHAWAKGILKLTDKCECCGVTWDQAIRLGPQCYLTPRYALQIMGTEGGRHCYSNIWVENGLNDAKAIEAGYHYDRGLGIIEEGPYPTTAVFTDARFINEVEAIQHVGGKVFRVKRPGFDKPRFNHPSETEQMTIPDDRLQGVIHNDGTLEDLERKVIELLQR